MHKAAERCEKVGRYCVDVLVFVVLFILNPGHTFNEVKEGVLEQDNHTHGLPSNSHICVNQAGLLFSEAEKIFHWEEERKRVIDDKSKLLLTISALLIAGISAMSAYVVPRWALIFPLLPALLAIILVLVYFRMQSVQVIDLEEVTPEMKENELKLMLANNYIECANYLSPRNDYQAGVYRAAARAIMLAVILFIPVFLIASFSQLDDKKLLKEIRENSEIRKELMGPPDPRSPARPAGPQGKEGAIGPPGPREEGGPIGKELRYKTTKPKFDEKEPSTGSCTR